MGTELVLFGSESFLRASEQLLESLSKAMKKEKRSDSGRAPKSPWLNQNEN